MIRNTTTRARIKVSRNENRTMRPKSWLAGREAQLALLSSIILRGG
jgi:hypothetical protein